MLMPSLGEQFRDRAAGAAHHRVVFQRDEALVAARQFQDQLAVERLDEAHVDAAQAQFVGRRLPPPAPARRRRAGRRLRRAGATAPCRSAALSRRRLHRHARAAAARITHRGRAGMAKAGAEHLPAFVFVGRRHDQHVRDAAQVAEVEAAGMGRAVGPDHAAAIDREQHVEVLQRDVVDQLVVGALQEGRIDRHHRLGAFAGHARGQGHRVLFGDGGVEIALRDIPAKSAPGRSLRASPA